MPNFKRSFLARLAVFSTIAFGSAAIVSAGTYNFSYLADIGPVTGQMTGTLQPDLNTLVVTNVSGVVFNGNEPYTLPYLVAFSDYVSGSGLPPTVTVDGSFMDLCATDLANCSGIGFILALQPGYGFYNGLNDVEGFDAARWSLTDASVPEPSGMLLMGTGLAAVLAIARRGWRL